jgi:hypothetical protein
MKYRGLIFVTAAIGLITFVMPALSNMMWSDFANDPQYQEIAKSVKQMHELTMQIAGIMYMPGILSIIISTLLLGGNLVVAKGQGAHAPGMAGHHLPSRRGGLRDARQARGDPGAARGGCSGGPGQTLTDRGALG